MTVEERLDRLEQRLSVLEGLMRQLAAAGAAPRAGPVPPASPLRSAPPAVPPGPPSPAPAPAPAAPVAAGPAERRDRLRFAGSEEWIGQRGLLAIGVLALLLAAGYLLKLSFDRGWISPLARCLGGAVAGVGVGALGWRLLGRYRTYGAALIGCGAGIVYLTVWAASRLYGFLPSGSGILALALVSLSLAAIAYAISVEALGSTAALGAFFAPVLLGQDRRHGDLLLLYLGCMGLALGWVAAQRRWRSTAAVIAVSYFGLGWSGAASARPPGAWVYTVLGGAGGIYLGLREAWWETRLIAFWGGWALLATVADRLEPRWLVFVAGALLAAPVWRHALRQPAFWPVRFSAAPAAVGWSLGEMVYFFATPFLLGWAVRSLAPDLFAVHDGLAALVVAVPYLAAGFGRVRSPFALVGVGAVGVAVLERWPGLEAAAVLLGLALLWAGLDHLLNRSDGRWYAVLTLSAGIRHLLQTDQARRGFEDAAFVGHWALVLWLAIGVTLGLAAGLWRRDPPGEAPRLARAGLWLLGGGLTLFGVTGEITRYFRQQAVSPSSAELASGLAVSAWWLIFAAALVTEGLRRSIRPARLAGLTVAGLAVLKVLVFDLSSLDALYRVGSVLILGFVSLLLAYLYHRQARGSRA